jgi:hypothetical protein
MKSTKDASVLHIIAINKTESIVPLNITLAGDGYKTAVPFRLTSAALRPQAAISISLAGNVLSDRLPPLSVTTFEIRK